MMIRTVMNACKAAAIAAAAAAWAGPAMVASAQDQDRIATSQKAAETIIGRAPAAEAFLDIGVKSFTPPQTGSVDIAVSVTDNSGREQEVGRFAIFPAAPFTADTPSDERVFRLDVSSALADMKPDGPLKVRVRLVPPAGSETASGAALTLGKVQLSPRS